MKNLFSILLFIAVIIAGGDAYSQIKGEAACRKFLQDDFFKRLNEWSDAACNPQQSDVSAKRSAVTQALAIKKLEPITDEISAANVLGDGWFGFFSNLCDTRKPFHCTMLSAKAICESRHGVWMQVEFDVKYDGNRLTAHDYMCVQVSPFGGIVDMIRSNPPDDCEFDAATYVTVKGRVVDDLGNSLPGYSVTVRNSYTSTLPVSEATYKNETFTIDKVAPFSVLEVQRLGYEPQMIPVNGRTDMDVIKLKKLPMSVITVSGKVVDEFGNSLSGFRVALKDSSVAENQYSALAKNGTFTIGAIPLESVLVISKPGYDTQEIAVDGRADVDVVKLTKSAMSEIEVTGKVVDEFGYSLSGFMVVVADPSVEDYAVAFHNEIFTIGYIPLDSELEFSKPGYETVIVPVNGRGNVGVVKLKKAPLTIIKVSGKVMDEFGYSLSGFSIKVNDSTAAPSTRYNITTKNETFVIGQIPVDASFTVSKPGYDPLEVPVNGRTDINVKLKKAPPAYMKVAGRVLDEFGNALSDFKISVVDTIESSSAPDYGITTKNNTFALGNAPSDGALIFSKPGYATTMVKVGRRADLDAVQLAKAPTPASQIPGSFTETVNGVPFNMVMVEGGTFDMGATDEQGSDAYNWEKPVHSVAVESFHVGQTEVTFRMWKAVMGSLPEGLMNMDTSAAGNNLPVVNVSWNDARMFVARLNEITGKNYRLLTDAEWEYAARGGRMSKHYKYSGSNNIDDVAWVDANSSKRPSFVGKKQPNELGIYDMSGNVWEWCQDVYREYDADDYSATPSPSDNGDSRVYRGGSNVHEAGYSRVSYRHYLSPDYRNIAIGFRLAL